jgi:STE24 endopeptidase
MDPTIIKYLLVGILTLNFAFDKILNWLNVNREIKSIPNTLDQYLSKEKLVEHKNYQLVNYKFGLVTGIFSFLLTVGFIWFGFFGFLDEWLRTYIQSPIFLSIVYFGIVFIGSGLISIPFDYYHTFKIEEDFGFNKSTKKTFFLDKIKSYLLSVLIGGVLLFALLWLVLKMGTDFWWQFWIIASIFMVLVNMFFSALILPLFNKLSPLEEGELKKNILDYARSVGFSLDNVFVMDGSKRSTKANAFFSGLGKRKKVVLYDTLLEQHTTQELVAVLAHEIGHYKKGHIKLGIFTGIVQTGIILYILSLFIFSENISLALGGSQMAVHLNIIGFTMLFSPISTLLGIAMNILSRKHEFEADEFARKTFDGKPLAEALKTLSVKTLSNLNPHPAYVFVHYSHPPLMRRLEKLE